MISSQARARLALVGAAAAVATLVGGCGDNYRPTVTPVNPTGPASQATSYAIAVSTTGSSTPGVVTIIDYSGDTKMNETKIGTGPTAFTLDEGGYTGYTVNSDGTMSSFEITTSLQAKDVGTSTVAPAAQIVNMMAPSSGLWVADLYGDVIDLFSGSPAAFKQAMPVSVSGTAVTMPVFVAGSPTLTGEREYAISQNLPDTDDGRIACNLSPATAPNGVATSIEISSHAADAALPVGRCPVYAVGNSAVNSTVSRLFVLNRGDDTITVINTRNNTLDSCTPFQNQNGEWVTCHQTIQLPSGSGPVYAEYNSANQQLVVANYDGGTVSVIDVPMDNNGNDANTYANSTCSTYAECGAVTGGFGTVHTIKVGNTSTPNPAAVTVLLDGTKAYTANQGDGASNGTVTVVNLATYTVEKTLTVVGHPRTVLNTQNSEYSKVYVASPDSPYVTIIQSTPTVADVNDTTVLTQGKVVDLRVTTENGSKYINTYSSRVPGYGQPCNLPPSLMVSTYLTTNYTIGQCQTTP